MRFSFGGFLALFPLLLHPTQVGAQTIFEAVREGDEAAVQRLLAEDPELVRLTDDREATPLHHAAGYGRTGIVRLLLEHGADPNLQDYQGHAPLHLAGMYGRDEVVTVLLELGGELELEQRDDYGRTPLLLVARESGSGAAARALLDHGADPDALDRYGASSLNLAAWRGFEDVVNALLDHGAALDAGGSRASVLPAYAAQGGLERLFRALAEAGADFGSRTENGGSLLHAAAEGGSEEIVGTLLDRGFDATERDRYGWTPLHYAAQRGREGVSALLISRGADVNAVSVGGHTPLSVTDTYGMEAEARLLESHGAHPSTDGAPRRAGPWMGEKPPGLEPTVFAPDLVSSNRFEHGTVTFSPDGKEAFWESSFMPNETGYSQGRILTSRLEDGRWTPPEFAPFSPSWRTSHGRILTSRLEEGGWTAPAFATFSPSWRTNDDVPFFHPLGDALYFDSSRPDEGEDDEFRERLRVVRKTAEGWGDPELIQGGPNTMGLHWQFSVAANGNLYFGSDDPGGFGAGDVWLSRWVDGVYYPPENLGPAINTPASEDSPFIAPDESYLLFTGMDRPDSMGGTDLYITFRRPDGGWTEPMNLGSPVNTASNDLCPQVSPGGRFLFWNSHARGNADVYWVDAGFLQALREEVLR
ncbi:MAG: ankyrin repeat domain-containing protein [Longimicrobiales bacterium]